MSNVWIILVLVGSLSDYAYAAVGPSLQILQQSLTQLSSLFDQGQDYHSLSWWVKKVGDLKFQGTILTGQRNFPEGLIPLIDYAVYSRELEAVTKLNADQINQSIKQAIDEDSFFAEKAVLTMPATIYCWGDFHGDIHTLVESLKSLNASENILDDNFKINKTNVYFIFNGDYVDRGWNGVEVHTVLSLLRQNNPENVFLMRGNHEAFDLNERYGFIDEIEGKFLQKDLQKIKKLIKDFYTSLPAVLYVGVRQEAKLNYLQFCHGGLEFYNPINLLSHDWSKKLYFERIDNRYSKTTLQAVYSSSTPNGKKELSEILKDILWGKFKNFQSTLIVDDLQAISRESDVKKKWSLLEPLLGTKNLSVDSLGYMWSDFNALDAGSIWDPNRGAVRYGLALSDIVLELPRKNIVAVFRAHQHNSSMPGLFIEANRNIYKLTYMKKHLVFTGVATPTMMQQSEPPIFLPGRGFMKIKIESENPIEWKLTSIWSKCKSGNPTSCEKFNKETHGTGTLVDWKSV
jgi:hypothetical protein